MHGTKDWLALAAFVVLAEGAGALGSIFTAPAITGWYAAIVRPEIAPPNWVFGPVWTTLFFLMGVAAFLVWKKKPTAHARVRAALRMFVWQLVLNVLWSVIFFGLKSPGWAFAELLVLWLAIAATIVAFARVSKPAAWLLAPYLGWVTFAGYLNYLIWSLNS